jgi:Cdc6-like AAA superfamily ATPase
MTLCAYINSAEVHTQYQLVENIIMQIMLSVLKGVLAIKIYEHKWKSSGVNQKY